MGWESDDDLMSARLLSFTAVLEGDSTQEQASHQQAIQTSLASIMARLVFHDISPRNMDLPAPAHHRQQDSP